MMGLQREGKALSVFDVQENSMREGGRQNLYTSCNLNGEEEEEYMKVQEQSMYGKKRMREVKTASVTFGETIIKSRNVS